jgi:indolepyruvate ferredoxin oxidoreductase
MQVRVPDHFQLPEDYAVCWPDPPLAQEAPQYLQNLRCPRPRQQPQPVMLDSPNPRLGIVTTGKSYSMRHKFG